MLRTFSTYCIIEISSGSYRPLGMQCMYGTSLTINTHVRLILILKGGPLTWSFALSLIKDIHAHSMLAWARLLTSPAAPFEKIDSYVPYSLKPPWSKFDVEAHGCNYNSATQEKNGSYAASRPAKRDFHDRTGLLTVQKQIVTS